MQVSALLLKVVQTPATLGENPIPLYEGKNLIGRDEHCDIYIPDTRISSRHVLIQVTGNKIEVFDQGSTNGVFLDGKRIQEAHWEFGQVLLIGDTQIILKALVENPSPSGYAGTGNTSKLTLNNDLFDFSIVSERKIQAFEPTLQALPEDKVQQTLQRMQILYKVVKSLHATLSVTELLDRVMLLFFEALHCDTGYILLVNTEDSETIHSHLAYEAGQRKENLQEKLYSKTLVTTVMKKRMGFIFDLDENQNRDSSLSILELKIKTALCCPIHSEGNVFGVIYLDHKKRGTKFTEDDLELTLHIAGIVGMAIENLNLYKKLKTETRIRDHLKRFLSPNVAEKIIAEQGSGNFHLQSQKTHVVILFADIRGFTSLSENLPPLEIAQLLNLYFSEMCQIIFTNGGTLDKFIGDCMMVLFNVPLAISNPEHVAVQTAQQMRQRLRILGPIWREQGIPEFQVGIGINAGEAVVGSLGTSARMEYTALGDCVNIASRVCGVAKPDQILITDTIYRKLQGELETRYFGATQLKGKKQTVEIYEVVG